MEEEHFGRNLVVVSEPSLFIPKIGGELEPCPLGQWTPILKRNLLSLVFSFFNGADLLHTIALLSKDTRESLPGSGLLD